MPPNDLRRKDYKKEEDLSEEDLKLKEQLEFYVEMVQDPDPGLQKVALEKMRRQIQTSTSTMTSVPKPLKFLRPLYASLKSYYKTLRDSEMKKLLADVLSVLALTQKADGDGESLKFRLLGSEDDIGSWGHEYLRNLAGEIPQEYSKRQEKDASVYDRKKLVQQIVSFPMTHNAEAEAVDLLTEVEYPVLLVKLVDKTNFKRTCLYLKRIARYFPGLDDTLVLDIAYRIYMKFREYPNALQMALDLDKVEYIRRILTSRRDLLRKKQLCTILARHRFAFKLDKKLVPDNATRESLQKIIGNNNLSEWYLYLARELEVMEPKSPEDIYKAHLVDGENNDSDLQNLAATFVNAFINAGFGQFGELFETKEDRKISAIARPNDIVVKATTSSGAFESSRI